MYIMPKTAAELSKVDNIVAIKEASGNIAHVVELVAACEGRLDLYSGNDDQVLPLLSLGGLGVISVAANILPREMHDMVHSYLDGDHEKSLKLQLKMFPLMKSLFYDVNPIPIKQALAYMGSDFDAGICRPPLTNMEDTGLTVVKNAMIDYGFKLS
jgi:4-hydroxy-tetrahydrodipicolinate synthase